MKAILVIEKPKSCKECPMWTHTYHYDWGREYPVEECCLTDSDVCPLKPMPKRKRKRLAKDTGKAVMNVIAVGWNACLDEILGEKYESNNDS